MNYIVYSTTLLKFFLYADDTTVYTSDVTPSIAASVMNDGLCQVALCQVQICNLTLNIDKSSYMLFKRRQNSIIANNCAIKISGVEIERVRWLRFLGVEIDECLSWKQHVDATTKKYQNTCQLSIKTRDYLNRKSLKLIFDILIYPSLIYCNSVWGGATDDVMRELQLVLKRVVRAIHLPPIVSTLCLCLTTFAYLQWRILINICLAYLSTKL